MHSVLRNNWVIAVIILSLNLVLKWIHIDSISIDGDEPFTLFYSLVDSNEYWEMMSSENNPPLYFLLERIWLTNFGTSVQSIRFLPFVFSSLSALVIFRIGQKHFTVFIGIMASLLFTFSTYHFLFSHENRAYALFGLLTLLSMNQFLKAFKDPSDRLNFLVLMLINAALMYTHFFGFFVLLTQGVACLFISSFRKDVLKPYILLSIGVFILFSPYIFLTIFRFQEAASGTWLDSPNLVEIYNMLWKWSNQPVNTVIFLSILAAGLVLFLSRKKQFIQKQSF